MLPSLAILNNYRNQQVLNRYENEHPNNKLNSEEAFSELLKYFWLSQKHKKARKESPHDKHLNFTCVVHTEMKEMDDMWHTFLLFTKDYMDFCHNYFGEYIHHYPAKENEALQNDKFEREFNQYLSYIYDNLGEDTLNVWFHNLLEEAHSN